MKLLWWVNAQIWMTAVARYLWPVAAAFATVSEQLPPLHAAAYLALFLPLLSGRKAHLEVFASLFSGLLALALRP